MVRGFGGKEKGAGAVGARPHPIILFILCSLMGICQERKSGQKANVDSGLHEHPASFDKLSDCVECQAGCHGVWSRTMALRMVRSFRMQATMATILGLPLARRRWRKARMVGL